MRGCASARPDTVGTWKGAISAISALPQIATSGRTSGASPSGCVCSAIVGEKSEPRRVYGPGDVAERLGVSGQRLRQLAAVFERVRGDLPRDDRGRVWPEPAVEELERARALVRDGRATGVEAALRGDIAPDGGEVPNAPARSGRYSAPGGAGRGAAGLAGGRGRHERAPGAPGAGEPRAPGGRRPGPRHRGGPAAGAPGGPRPGGTGPDWIRPDRLRPGPNAQEARGASPGPRVGLRVPGPARSAGEGNVGPRGG